VQIGHNNYLCYPRSGRSYEKDSKLEQMGGEALLHVLLDKCRLSVLTGEIGFKEGGIVNIEFDFRKAHT